MHLPPQWEPEDARRTPVTLRRDFIAQGFTDRALANLVRDGVLAKPRRGAYVSGPVWKRLDQSGRHAVRARAVIAAAKTELVLSHVSGLVEFGAPTWGMSLDEVQVTRLDGRNGRPEAGVRQHRGVVEDDDVLTRNGVRVMRPARLALEVSTVGTLEQSLVVANDLLHRRLTTGEELRQQYERMTYWPHSVHTDLVLRLADARIESVGETRTYFLCYQQSLPRPEPQYEVTDGSGRVVARVDFAWPELGVFLEFDGKVKYEKLLADGQRASDVVIAEKRREEMICRLTGWRCIRLTWADLERPELTAEIIRSALFPPSAAA